MELIVNGQAAGYDAPLTVGQLLAAEEVKMPEMVSVELNGRILRRAEFDTTALKADDKVEFLYFMGGGRDAV